ncbi:MAG: hypothetical protein PVJ75_12815, partial [Chloroflexota bacterium]
MNEVTVDKRFATLFILAFLLSACGLGDRAAAPTVAPTMPAPTATAAPATEAPLTEAPPAPAGEPDEQALGQAYIGSLRLSVLESFPVRVQAHIGGDLSDGCTNIAGVGVGRDGQTFRIQVVTTRDPA